MSLSYVNIFWHDWFLYSFCVEKGYKFKNFQSKKKFSKPFSKKASYKFNYENLILDINTKDNDLQEAALKHSAIFKNFLKKIPVSQSISKPRMTGSGSTIFILFDNQRNAENYLDHFDKMNRSVWKEISQVLL